VPPAASIVLNDDAVCRLATDSQAQTGHKAIHISPARFRAENQVSLLIRRWLVIGHMSGKTRSSEVVPATIEMFDVRDCSSFRSADNS
jgi:hypothetical protein